MATVITLVDDLNGSTDGVKTIKFSLDGVDYEIDLNAEHSAELTKIIKHYAGHGRVQGQWSLDAADSRIIRDWARDHGYDLASRGSIPAGVIDKFMASQRS